MVKRVTVLTKPKWLYVLAALAPGSVMAESLDDLSGGDCLVAFATGIIVPRQKFSLYQTAYNIHAAPPSYPGRDPHHWGCYDKTPTWGATLHIMTERVDEGPIISVSEQAVAPDITPSDRLQVGLGRATYLFNEYADRFGKLEPNGIKWTGQKRSRADLLLMCELDGLTKKEEMRRRFAFEGFPFKRGDEAFHLTP